MSAVAAAVLTQTGNEQLSAACLTATTSYAQAEAGFVAVLAMTRILEDAAVDQGATLSLHDLECACAEAAQRAGTHLMHTVSLLEGLVEDLRQRAAAALAADAACTLELVRYEVRALRALELMRSARDALRSGPFPPT